MLTGNNLERNQLFKQKCRSSIGTTYWSSMYIMYFSTFLSAFYLSLYHLQRGQYHLSLLVQMCSHCFCFHMRKNSLSEQVFLLPSFSSTSSSSKNTFMLLYCNSIMLIYFAYILLNFPSIHAKKDNSPCQMIPVNLERYLLATI